MRDCPPRFLIPALCVTIFLGAAATGFVYTAFYHGWGHSAAAAPGVGFGLGAVVVLVTGMATGQLHERTKAYALALVAAFWIFAATLLFISA